ncbi:MAG: TAXI family TRAP transporter solute-binding subunit [Alphaproteobacteria bacterium]|nr:TAXI family TRAP transporter solute-binding subunit [Alphaproteobacteria bacterium]
MSRLAKWVLALLFCVAPTLEVLAQDRISFGTTRTQSSVYAYGVAAAKAINTISGDKINVTVVATGGAVDNLARLSRKQIQMGLGNMATVYQQYKGLGKFKGKAAPTLRGLWTYQTSRQAFIVRKDSGVTEISQLTGKKWTAGQRGSGTENLVTQVLTAIGVKPDYYRATLADALKAIKDRRSIGYAKAMQGKSLDATSRELDATIGIRLLGFTGAQQSAIVEKFPFLSISKFGKDEISGHPAFATIASVSGIFTNADVLDDAQVMAILKGIVEGKKIQEEAFPPFRNRDVATETLAKIPIPLHSGAVKFYKAKGLKVPDRLIPPEAKK